MPSAAMCAKTRTRVSSCSGNHSSQAYQACKGIVIFCGRLQHWDSAVFLTLASGLDGFGTLFSMIVQMPNIVHMIL